MLVLMCVPVGRAEATQPENVACSVVPNDNLGLAVLTLEKVNNRPATVTPTLNFGDRRKPKSITLDYKVTGCRFSNKEIGTPVMIQFIGPRSNANDDLAADAFGGMTVKASDVVVATYGVDPANGTDAVIPGVYAGGFVVTDLRFAQYRENADMTFSYANRSLLAVTLIFPALLVGTFFVWYKGRAGGSRESYWAWFRKGLNLVAVGVGFGAATVYFQANVVDKVDFGADLVDRSPLFWFTVGQWWGAALGLGSAFISAVLLASSAGDKTRGGTDPSEVTTKAGALPD